MSVVIVVPMASEVEPFVSSCASAGVSVSSKQIGSITGYDLPEIGAVLAVAGHGKAQFAATTSYLLCHCPDVQTVICIGAAGSLTPGLSLGDVVVSTATVEHDYRIRFVEQPVPEHATDTKSIEQLRKIVARSNLPFGVYFGKIASGDEDVIESQRAGELASATGALCVAWEGSGGARAAALHGKPYLEIRTITDSADLAAPTTFRENLATAMPNLAVLLARWLRPTSDKRCQ